MNRLALLPLLLAAPVGAAEPDSLEGAWAQSFIARTQGLPGECQIYTGWSGAIAYCTYEIEPQADDQRGSGDEPCLGEDCLIGNLP